MHMDQKEEDLQQGFEKRRQQGMVEKTGDERVQHLDQNALDRTHISEF
jgi:hypothetical protein